LDSTSRELLKTHLLLANLLSEKDWTLIDRLTLDKATNVAENSKNRQLKKFTKLYNKQHPATKTMKDTVINLSDQQLDGDLLSLLQKGLNYAVTPKATPIEDILTGVEKAIQSLPAEKAEEARQETVRILKNTKRPRDNLSKAERTALKNLKDNTNLTILPADKGNATVILNTTDYKQKISTMLQEPAYKKLKKDPTAAIERTTTRLLKRCPITEETRRQLAPSGSKPPRLYGLPKIHKEGVPLRPIVSNIGAPTYKLSKHLSGLLNPLIGKSVHNVKNSFHFIEILKSLQTKPGDLMVSFDVVSLFTKVPVEEAITLLSRHFKDEDLALYKHVLTSTYFCVDGQFFLLSYGVAMGSPLSPVIANFYMEEFEKNAIATATNKPACWYRYVDDTFVIWPHGQKRLMEFLEHLNGINKNT
jgi:hypothetical protein